MVAAGYQCTGLWPGAQWSPDAQSRTHLAKDADPDAFRPCDNGIVKREDRGTVPPHVTYELTQLGKSLRQEVGSLVTWVETNVPELSAATRN